MSVILAFIFVVLIWGTTPLAIGWSNSGPGFMAAVTLRMSLALVVGLAINLCLGKTLFRNACAWRAYFVASMGIFPAMPLVYWSAQFIPTGLIAVIFSLSPFITGVMTLLLLGDNPFNHRSIFGLVLAIIGLVIIFSDQLSMGPHFALGIVGVLLSITIFSFSSVMLKKLNIGIDAFEQTTGSLLFAVPSLLLMWLLFDGVWPLNISFKSGAAIVYLAVLGSLLGFTLFFYVLKNMEPITVSLSTLITPVLALTAGAWLADESLSASTIIGVVMVILSLVIYLGLFPFRKRAKNGVY